MLAKHSLVYFLGRIIPGIVSVSTLAILTHSMSKEDYGNYSIMLSAIGFFNAVFFQWLSLAISRYYASSGCTPDVVNSVAVIGFLCLALIACLAGLCAAVLLDSAHLRWMVGIIGVSTLAQAWFDMNLRVASARLDPYRYSIATSLKSIIGLTLGFGLLSAGYGVFGFFSGISVALALTSFLFYKQWAGFDARLFNGKLLLQFGRYGAPMALMFFLVIVIDTSDRYLIAWFLGSEAVGLYSPAYEFAQQTLGVLIGTIGLASLPLVVSALELRGQEAAQQQLIANGKLLMQVSIPATIGLIVLADDISSMFFGEQFQAAANQIIPIIAVATLVAGLRTGYYDLAFQLGFRVRRQLILIASSASLNVLLNLFLIPLLGYVGAAWATLIALLSGLSLSVFLGKAAFPIPALGGEKYKVICCAIIMAVALLVFRSWHGPLALLCKLFIGLMVYAFCCIILDVNNSRCHYTYFFNKLLRTV